MRKLSLLIFIIPFSTKLFGQLNLQQKISVSAKQVTLENFLNRLETEFHVIQSYGMDNGNGQCIISIEVENSRLMDVLFEAAAQCNLQCTVIGETIVFKARSPLLITVEPKVDQVVEPVIPTNRDPLFIKIPSRAIPLQSLFVKIDSIKIPSINLAHTNVAGNNSHRVNNSHASVFINYGLDINYYSYRDRDLDFQYFKTKSTPTITLGLSYNIASRWQVAVASSWSRREVTLHHNFQVLDEEDPFPIMNRTSVDMNYREISASLSYIVMVGKHHGVSLATRYSLSYLYSVSETTTYLNSPPKKTSIFVDDCRKRLASIELGVSYQYHVGKSWMLSVDPFFGFCTSSPNGQMISKPSKILRTHAALAYKFLK
jgi:hypothetical protein